MKQTINIGLVGVGLETYWTQFTDLKSRLESYQTEIAQHITQFDTSVTNVGIVDNLQKSIEAAEQFKRAQIEMLFIFIFTYALFSTIRPRVQQ